MKFRIKQIDENIYIPQLKKNLFSSWCGIDNNWNEIWWDAFFQTKYCSQKTYQDALNEIEIWKTKNHKKKNYPKYFEV